LIVFIVHAHYLFIQRLGYIYYPTL